MIPNVNGRRRAPKHIELFRSLTQNLWYDPMHCEHRVLVEERARALAQGVRRARGWSRPTPANLYSGCSRAGKSPIPDQDSGSGTDERLSIGIHYRYQNY